VMLSGLGHTAGLRRWMKSVEDKVQLTLVDGALSRMSLASPTVSEAMILATGAAYSANIDTLVRKTAYIVELIQTPLYREEEGKEVIEIMGAVTNRTLEQILCDPNQQGKELVIQDFTKVFADDMTWHRFCKTHVVSARCKSRLIAITVNPTAPNGMVLDSTILQSRLREATGIDTYDLKQAE